VHLQHAALRRHTPVMIARKRLRDLVTGKSNRLPSSQTSTLKPAAAATQRDHRIDWLRGIALVSIFINHMPGNRFENWTTRNFGFSDAAELFVLLAGMAAAFAFFPRMLKGDMPGVALKAVRRAGVLYSMHIVSTLAAVGVFASAAWLIGNPEILELIGVAPMLAEPLTGLGGVLLGGHQLGYFNILPLYVFLILLVPAYMWLAARDLRLMLAVSFSMYLTAHMLPIDMPNFPTDEGWFFNPFAWQLLFASGMALGAMRVRGQSVAWHPVAGAIAATYALFAAVWMIGDLGGRVSFDLLPHWIDTLAKSALPATRYLHIMALAYLLGHSPVWPWLKRFGANNFLTVLGRNSLPVFVLGSLLSMVGYITLVHTGSVLWLELALTVGGVALMTVFARFVEAGLPGRIMSQVALRAPALVQAHSDIETSDTPTGRR
jgi:hypothetical protein